MIHIGRTLVTNKSQTQTPRPSLALPETRIVRGLNETLEIPRGKTSRAPVVPPGSIATDNLLRYKGAIYVPPDHAPKQEILRVNHDDLREVVSGLNVFKRLWIGNIIGEGRCPNTIAVRATSVSITLPQGTKNMD